MFSHIASLMMETEVVSERVVCFEPTRACNIRLQRYVRAAACLLSISLNFVWMEFKIQFQVPEDTLFVIPSSYAFCK
jgi:hypothetical protein